jgi:hypothetical protein
MPHTFLSDEWLTEAKKISDEFGGGAEGPGSDLQINVTVVDGPEGDRELHLSQGVFDSGHIDGAPTKLTVPYEVAKDMFVNGNQQAAMQAFMSGQIKVEGDMTKLMAMQSQGANPNQAQIQERLKEITEV